MSLASWMPALGHASLDAVVLILAVALLIHLLPRIPAAARCSLWWLAALGALVAGLGLPGITLPVLPGPAAAAGTATTVQRAVDLAREALPALGPAVAPPSAQAEGLDLATLAAGWLALIWLAGLAFMVLVHGWAAHGLLGTWRAARPFESADVRAWLAHWLGPERALRVQLRSSDAVRAPLILGWGRPRILVPARCAGESASVVRMALAHETGHLLRHDLLWGWLPALAECVFWYHPVVRWGVREYAQAREEACDALALELTGAEPGGYGEMLIGFGVDRTLIGRAAASCGSAHVRHLTRRLQMLSHATMQSRTQRVAGLAAVVILGALAIVPVRLVAADRAAPAPPAAPAAPAAPADTPARKSGTVDRSERGADDRNSFSYGWSDFGQDDFSFGLLAEGDQTFSGSFDEGRWDRVRRIHDRFPGKIFWFRLKGLDYVVRDRDAWDRVSDLLEPQRELGRRQSELGEQQSRLGGQQAGLGGQQAELGGRQAELSARLSVLSTQMAYGNATRSERAELSRKIDDLHRQIRELGRRQSELGRRQSELGAQQGELGSQQGELGNRQAAESERARVKIRKLAQQCVRDGRAERQED